MPTSAERYHQLSPKEIETISTMRRENVEIVDIAKVLKRNRRTIAEYIRRAMPPEFHSRPTWKHPPEVVEAMRAAWAKGDSASTIADTHGVSRNVVIGLAHRHKFERTRAIKADIRRRAIKKVSKRNRRKDPRPYVIGNGNPKVITRRDMAEALRPEPYLVLPDEPPLIHSILDLGDNQCRWPIGDPQDDRESFGFCGKVKHSHHFSYCSAHLWRATRNEPPPTPETGPVADNDSQPRHRIIEAAE